MQPSRRLGAAGKHETLQFGKVGVELVAERFEPIDRGLLDAQAIGDTEWD